MAPESDVTAEDVVATQEVPFDGGPIVGRVKLTEQDFTAVWKALPQNRRVVVQFGVWILCVPLIIIFISGALGSKDGEPVSLSPFVWAMPIAIAALAYGVWRGRKTWAKNAVADLRGSEGVEFRFDAAGFSLVSPGRQSQDAWSSLYRCIETPQAFAIYTAPAMVMVVPKRAFADSEHARLRSRLLELIPNRPLRGADVGRKAVRTLVLRVVLIVAFLAIWRFLNAK